MNPDPFASIDAFDQVAGVAAFLAVTAALGGLVGRSFEVLRPGRDTESIQETEMRITRATTVGSLLGLAFGGVLAAMLLIV